MKALILAAGFASRLRPLTDTIPKCLLGIGGKPILQRTLEHLDQHGITDLCVVTGYRAGQIAEYIDSRFGQFRVTYIHNSLYRSTNNIYSLYLAREFVLGNDIYLLDSDIIFDRRILTTLHEFPEKDCLALRSYGPIGEEEMKVSVDETGRVLQVSKQIPVREARGESIGIEKFSAGFIEKLFDQLTEMIENEGLADKFYELAFQRVIDSGVPLYAVDVGELRCVEIDTIEDLETAEKEVLQYLDR
jgi:choline kinase